MQALRRAAKVYSDKYDNAPYMMAYCTCFAKGCVATSIAMATEPSKSSDEKNLRRFFNYAAVFGGVYCGMGQHFLYNSLYPRLFGATQSFSVAGMQIMTECCVANPFIAMPLYYCCKAVIEGEGTVESGLAQYREEFWQVFQEYCLFWVPAHVVTFGFMPPQFRIAWVASVSVAYLSRLSFVSHQTELEEARQRNANEEAAEVATE
jgi:hypothetical protein